jgi:hypothetical protein
LNASTCAGDEITVLAWLEPRQRCASEEELIGSTFLPLNLDQNKDGEFHLQLSQARAAQRGRARALPIL